MKAKVTLNNSIWDTPKRRALIEAALLKAGQSFERDVKLNIQRSVPAGRTYRKNAITRAVSQKTLKGLRIRTTAGGKQVAVIGYNFHRASRRGQPPAIDTGRLINSIRMQQLSQLKVRIGTAVKYAARLDGPAQMDRPFFASVFNANKQSYLSAIDAAITSAIK